MKFIDGLIIPDDAYLSLTLARNMGKGLGPLYGLDYTNGFQPLYVFLMAPVYALFPNNLIIPVHLALVLLAVVDTLTLYLLFRLIASQSESQATPFVIMAAWIFNSYIIRTSLNGMETAISAFFIIACCYFYQRYNLEFYSAFGRKLLFVFGVLLGLALLARIDNIFLIAVIIFAISTNAISTRRNYGSTAADIAILAAGIILAYLPWLIYSYHYTGDLMPISGKAVRYMSLATVNHVPDLANWYLPTLKQGAMALVGSNWFIIGLLLVLISFLLVSKTVGPKTLLGRLIPFNIYLAFSVMLFCSYVFYIFGPWFFTRYFYPLAFLIIFYLAVVIDLCIMNIKSIPIKKAIVPALIIFIVLANLARPWFQKLYFNRDTTSRGYMNLGLWAEKNFPPGTKIGSSQTGALGYFAPDLKVVNLDGVVNKKCFESLRRKENMEYIRHTGIEYVIGWEINFDFIKSETRNYKPDDLILVSKIDGFRSWEFDWWLYRVNPSPISALYPCQFRRYPIS